jgi:hypothetical protein
MNISDQSVKIAGVYILFVYSPSNPYAEADLSFANDTYEQVYCFADKVASLSGTVTCGEKTYNWNFSLKSGWNRLTAKQGTTNINDEMTNNTIDGGEWILIN